MSKKCGGQVPHGSHGELAYGTNIKSIMPLWDRRQLNPTFVCRIAILDINTHLGFALALCNIKDIAPTRGGVSLIHIAISHPTTIIIRIRPRTLNFVRIKLLTYCKITHKNRYNAFKVKLTIQSSLSFIKES